MPEGQCRSHSPRPLVGQLGGEMPGARGIHTSPLSNMTEALCQAICSSAPSATVALSGRLHRVSSVIFFPTVAAKSSSSSASAVGEGVNVFLARTQEIQEV
jgi:hypothetical protein